MQRKNTEKTEIMEITEITESLGFFPVFFRYFRYFRLFRILFLPSHIANLMPLPSQSGYCHTLPMFNDKLLLQSTDGAGTGVGRDGLSR